MAILHVESVSKSFGPLAVLHEVSFQAAEGEILCLLGPSGCGKTTLLRIIAGLETPDAGRVVFEGRDLAGVPAHARGFGLMFQDYALFPHRDVAGNVAFGLRMQGMPPAQVRAHVAEMLSLVGLEGAERRRVYELSGGEQQRVALARSLAPRPRLLMLDEPLGSLDRALREELLGELPAILRRVGLTALYVTHDQQEAFAVGDRVLIMDRGRVAQQGAPAEVYRQPASQWVARFLGLTNLLPGTVVAVGAGGRPEQGPPRTDAEEPGKVEEQFGRAVEVQTALGRLALASSQRLTVGEEVMVLIRPEAARLAADCPGEAAIPLEGTVEGCSFRGGHYRLSLRHASGLSLAFDLVPGLAALPRPGETARLALRPEAVTLLAG